MILNQLKTKDDIFLHWVNKEAEWFEKIPQPEPPQPFTVIPLKEPWSIVAFCKEFISL